MSRDVAAALLSALGTEALDVFFAVVLEFDSGTLRLWTGYGDLTVDGDVYTGTGTLMGLSDLEETAELAAAGATITLSGMPGEILSLALSEPYQNRPARILFGVLSDPPAMTEVFTATMDVMDLEDDADTAHVSLRVENALLDLERPKTRRLTNVDQQSRFPGDKGLEFVEELQDRDITWGRKAD